MSKFFTLLYFSVILGALISSQKVLACGKMKANLEEKTCCKTKNKAEKNDCCKSNKAAKSQEKHTCNGNCSHNSCKCANINFSVNLPQAIDLQLSSIILLSKNSIFSHNENQLPTGFYSIWLPPVIG